MDSDRYKKNIKRRPIQRSVNADDSPSFLRPKIIIPRQPQPTVTKQTPAQATLPKSSRPNPQPKTIKPIVSRQISSVSDNALPSLFDEDDNDIFGVWKKQNDLKKAHQAQEAKEKAAKAAAKILKKERKKSEKMARKGVIKNGNIANIFKPKIGKVMPGYNSIYKKYYFAGSIFIILPLCLLVAGSLMHNSNQPTIGKNPEVQGQAIAAKPDYSTLKPTSSDNQATQLKYDAKTKVASYNDVIMDIPITVSQQPFPEKFKTDPTGQVEALAKQMNANDKISTSDATAFAGVSIKGPQTVIFTKNDLLVFIYAENKIDQLALANYIEKMQ